MKALFLHVLISGVGFYALLALMKETTSSIGFYVFLMVWSNNVSVAYYNKTKNKTILEIITRNLKELKK